MSSAASAVREGLSLALQAAPGSCSSRAPALDPFVIRRSQTTHPGHPVNPGHPASDGMHARDRPSRYERPQAPVGLDRLIRTRPL